MPIILDPDNVATIEKNRDIGHRRGMFDQKHLTPKQKDAVIYRKLESLNTDISDTFHPPDSVWVEQCTGMPQSLKDAGLSPRIFVKRDGEDGNLSVDDGLILTFHGKCAGPRSMDDHGRVIDMEQAEELQELSGDEPSVWNLWEFRLASLVQTDGPQRTERLVDTEEDKRSRSENGMVDMITKAFSAVGAQAQAGQLNVSSMVDNPKDASSQMVRQLSEMSEEKRLAILDLVEAESDVSTAEPLVNKDTADDTSFNRE